MRAGQRRSIGAGSKVGCVLDVGFRHVDTQEDGYFMSKDVYGHRCQAKVTAHWCLSGWYFDGDSDYITMPNTDVLEFGTSPFTVEALLYGEDTGDVRGYIGNRLDASGFVCYFKDAGQFEFYNGKTADTIRSTATRLDKTWCHVDIVRNGIAGNKIVIGSVEDTLAINSDDLADLDDDGRYVQIGRRNMTVPDRYFKGYIATSRIHNRAEYAARILQRAIDSRRN